MYEGNALNRASQVVLVPPRDADRADYLLGPLQRLVLQDSTDLSELSGMQVLVLAGGEDVRGYLLEIGCTVRECPVGWQDADDYKACVTWIKSHAKDYIIESESTEQTALPASSPTGQRSPPPLPSSAQGAADPIAETQDGMGQSKDATPGDTPDSVSVVPAPLPSDAEILAELSGMSAYLEKRYDLPVAEKTVETGPPDQQGYSDELAGLHERPWPTPVPVISHINRPPAFEIDCLPGPLQAFVKDVALRVGSDICLPAISALYACSAATDSAIRVQPRRRDTQYTEHARMWMMCTGESSSKKNPGCGSSLKPLQKIDMQKRDAATKLRGAWKMEVKHWEQACERSAKSGNPLPEAPPEPTDEAIICAATTIEGARSSLVQNVRGIALWNYELGDWFSSLAGRYNGGVSDRDAWLAADDGGNYVIARKDQAFPVRNWQVSVGGTLTPSKLAKYARELSDDGLLQRFVIGIAGDATPGEDREPDMQAIEAYTDILTQLADTRHTGGGALLFSEGAHKIREEFDEWRRELCADDTLEQGHRSHLLKFEGRFSRMCLLHSVIECAHFRQHPGGEISADTARRVFRFFRWQAGQVNLFWGKYMQASVRLGYAQRVAGLILRSPKLTRLTSEHFTGGPLNAEFKRLTEAELRGGITFLVQAGWIRTDGHARPGAAIQETYAINPKIREVFAEESRSEIERASAVYQAMEAGKAAKAARRLQEGMD